MSCSTPPRSTPRSSSASRTSSKRSTPTAPPTRAGPPTSAAPASINVGTGLSDAERNDPPPVGSIVTYRYQELSNDGVPRFPSYVGVRHDLPWPPPEAPAPVPAPAAPAPSDANRRSFVRGVTTWSIELDGRTVTVRDAAEATTRRNATPAGAWRDAERLIAEKLAAGYIEILP